jgi:hypothetical protein
MLMAPFLKRITRIPYAIDYIDPWVYQIKNNNLKARLSQWIARNLEGFALKHTSAIFAVSEGILNDLKNRFPSLQSKPLVAVPYGVESSDFCSIKIDKHPIDQIILRYTGAVSVNMLPVLDTFFKAIKKITAQFPLQVIFTGTSYAGTGMEKPVISDLIQANGLSGVIIENAARVGYRKALELSMSADMQLLIGDTTPYYAASKLMGLVASGRPFFAFVNINSFPAQFLEEINFSDRVSFLTNELNTGEKIDELAAALLRAIQNKDHFTAVEKENAVFLQYTAKAMTKMFTDTFQKIAHE